MLEAAIGAHELGTTQVVARFASDDTYVIEVTTDASALLARLERGRNALLNAPESAAEYQQAFDAVCDSVPRHLSLVFDDRESAPSVGCVVEKDNSGLDDGFNPPGVIVTLRGVIPPAAQNFRWRYDLTFASYALTVKSTESQTDQTIWLEGAEESRPLALGRVRTLPSRTAVGWSYFGLGFTHILPNGLDHILFVLGICLLNRHLAPILWQVSAFTLAHSITLGLSLYGLIALPSSSVEPLIALSIVYIALENLVTSELKPWRVALVFAFGLLHGMGFAAALGELSLPRSEVLIGLVAFNAGVEAGQLTVILAAFLLVGSWARRRDSYRRLIVVPGSAAIALAGLFWTIQRLTI